MEPLLLPEDLLDPDELEPLLLMPEPEDLLEEELLLPKVGPEDLLLEPEILLKPISLLLELLPENTPELDLLEVFLVKETPLLELEFLVYEGILTLLLEVDLLYSAYLPSEGLPLLLEML